MRLMTYMNLPLAPLKYLPYLFADFVFYMLHYRHFLDNSHQYQCV